MTVLDAVNCGFRGFSLFFSLLPGNFTAETGSQMTGCATTHSIQNRGVSETTQRPAIGGLFEGSNSLCRPTKADWPVFGAFFSADGNPVSPMAIGEDVLSYRLGSSAERLKGLPGRAPDIADATRQAYRRAERCQCRPGAGRRAPP
jgi:hypothetical protein